MNQSKFYRNILELMKTPGSDRRLKEEVKGIVLDELAKPENKGRIYPTVLNEFVLKYYMSKTAQKNGYGLEHVVDFLNWMSDEMGIPE